MDEHVIAAWLRVISGPERGALLRLGDRCRLGAAADCDARWSEGPPLAFTLERGPDGWLVHLEPASDTAYQSIPTLTLGRERYNLGFHDRLTVGRSDMLFDCVTMPRLHAAGWSTTPRRTSCWHRPPPGRVIVASLVPRSGGDEVVLSTSSADLSVVPEHAAGFRLTRDDTDCLYAGSRALERGTILHDGADDWIVALHGG